LEAVHEAGEGSQRAKEGIMGMMLWRIFFLIRALVCIGVLRMDLLHPSLWKVVGNLSNFTALAALCGFCFSLKIGPRFFWKVYFFVYLLIDFLGHFIRGLPQVSFKVGLFVWGLTVLLVIPSYIATYLYAFKRDDIWGEEASSK
jgi:hypothetical protein